MIKENITIFCADNDKTYEIIIQNILNDFNCIFFESGKACLEAIETKQPDLILLDIEIPDTNGLEICRKIKENNLNRFPIIFVTGMDSLEERLEGYTAGGDDYICKPFKREELLAKVNAALYKKLLLDKAHEEIKQASSTLSNILTTMGEHSYVMHFLQGTFNCGSFESLAQHIVRTHKAFGLQAAVALKTNDDIQYFNIKKALEESVFEYNKNKGRFVYFGKRAVINYPHVSILVRNMPKKDPELYGRICDYIALIGQGAESRIKALNSELMVKSQKECLIKFVHELEQTVTNIDREYTEQQNYNEHILSQLTLDIDESFMRFGLSDDEESTLRKFIVDAEEKTNRSYDNGLSISTKFASLLKQVNSAVEQINNYKTMNQEDNEDKDIGGDAISLF